MQAKIIQVGGTAALMLAGITLAAALGSAQAPATKPAAAAKAAPATKPASAAKPASADKADGATQSVRFTATTTNIADAKGSVRIDLLRYSTDAERDAVIKAWQQAVARAAALAAAGGKEGGAAGGGGRGGAAGRGGRAGGFGGAAADDNNTGPEADTSAKSTRNPLTPEGSLGAALDKAPVLGYLWSSEVSGYAVHYAVRLPQPDGGERIILITDRRLGEQNEKWKPVGTDKPNTYDFSIIEFRLNSQGQGEGKVSLTGKLAVDDANKVIALDNYAGLPVVFKNVGRKSLGKS